MKFLYENKIMKIAIFLMVICLWSNQGQAQLQWSDSQETKIDSAGNVIATWQSLDSMSGNFVIQAAIYDNTTATWSSATTISSTAVNCFSPRLAVNSGRDAVVIWVEDDLSGNIAVMGSIKPAAGSFSTATPVSDSNDLAILSGHFVNINDAGDIVATWGAFVDNTFTAVIRAATADVTSGTWNTPVTISP